MNKEADNVVFSDICEKVRFAVCFGHELGEEEKKHLEECSECRAYLEQIKIMENDLAEQGKVPFVRNGISVSDAVMKEIEKQSIFTGGRQLKKRSGAFRHMGLAAACIILAVMAMPVLNSVFLQEKNFAAEDSADYEYYSDEAAAEEDAVLYSVQEASASDGGEPEMFSVYRGSDSDEKQSAETESQNSDAEMNGAVIESAPEADESGNKAKAFKLTGGTAVSGSGSGATANAAYDSATITDYSGEVVMFEEAETETLSADMHACIMNEAVRIAKQIYGEDLKIVFSEVNYSADGITAAVKLVFDNGKEHVAEFKLENGTYKPITE